MEITNKLLRNTNSSWLVTGAAGFIGSNLCEVLLNNNQTVYAVDDFSTGLESNIEFLKSLPNSKNFHFKQASICNPDQFKDYIENSEYVLNQAAIGSVPRSIDQPDVSHEANVNGFFNLINSLRTYSNIKSVVYASSSSVYGDHPQLPKVEGQEGNVLSPYAATKHINECYASVFNKVYDFPIVGLRYFNVFGPRQNPKGPYAAVIPLWIEKMVDGTGAKINGDGSNSRDFCFIDNVVSANILAAFSTKACFGKVYNIACGGRTTLNELHTMIANSLKELLPSYSPVDAQYSDPRPGDIPHSHANISLAQKDLGYEPLVLIQDGIKQTVAHYLKNNMESK